MRSGEVLELALDSPIFLDKAPTNGLVQRTLLLGSICNDGAVKTTRSRMAH